MNKHSILNTRISIVVESPDQKLISKNEEKLRELQIFFSGNGKKLVFIKVVISNYLKKFRARAAGSSSCLLYVLILLTNDLHNSPLGP